MNVKEYLEKVAVIVPSDICDGMIYVTKFSGDYITRVGMEDNIEFLAELEITEELTHGAGFSPKDNKWYGWSHRGIFGFEIGSICKKGDCHFKASNIEEEIEKALSFWSDSEYHEKTWIHSVEKDKINIKWKYNDKVPNQSLRGKTVGRSWNYDSNNFGKGEWIAKTMEDAKQMAIDFNHGVS